MLELTIKTLDSQNHSFTLSDEAFFPSITSFVILKDDSQNVDIDLPSSASDKEATVLNLKESILEKMEVPIINQRLIFHGKVLQDQKKLTDYGDVNGKVIHLVQRAPPSSSRPADGSSSRRTEAGGGAGGGTRRVRREGNTTYLGSLAFPTIPGFAPEFLDWGIDTPTRPSQVMARNRLDCARRMMGYARQSIRHMEDPTTQPHPQPAHSGRLPRRQQANARPSTGPATEDRGTSTTSAPAPAEGAAQEPQEGLADAAQAATAAAIAAAVSAAQAAGVPSITILRGANNADGQPGVAFSTDGAGATMAEVNVNFDDHHQDVAVEVEIESSDANPEGRNEPEPNIRDNSAENRPTPRQEEATRVDAMVPLLTDLESINTDLQPFLARCRDFLSADTSFDDNSSPSYQEAVRVFGGVSETLHSVAHACHALSDLMVDFDEDAPRSLRCRPVVLQHSTILETGFPIRLAPQDFEAQINVRRVDVGGGGASPSGSRSATPPVNDVRPNSAPASAPANSAPAPASASDTAASASTSGSVDSQSSFTSVQVGRFQMNGPDGLPGDLEIFMDFGPGQLSPMGPYMDTPSSDAPETPPQTPARPEGATAAATPPVASAAATAPAASASAPINATRDTGFPPGFNITNFPATTPSGTFVATPGQLNSLHSSLQMIAGQIRNQLMGTMNGEGPSPGVVAAATALASAASARPSVLAGGITSIPIPRVLTGESESSDASQTPATPTPTPAPATPAAPAPRATTTPNTTSTGTTVAPEQAAAGSQTTPPRRIGGVPPPVADMLHSLFQGSFDPALPCNSHHIRLTRQRASQTQRMRIDMFPPNAAAPTAPTPPQILARRGAAMMAAAQGGRLVAVAVPPPQPPARPPAPHAPHNPPDPLNNATMNVLLETLFGTPFTFQLPGEIPMPMRPDLTPNASAADYLHNIVGSSHVDGQSIFGDLFNTVARNMTWVDLVGLIGARSSMIESVLERLRPALQEFATQRLLQGEAPNQESYKRVCDRLANEMRPYIEAMHVTRLRESVDLSATINNYNLSQLPEIIALIVEPGAGVNFGPSLMRHITAYVRQLVAIIIHCCVDDDQGFDSIVRNCVRVVTRGVPEPLQQWTELQSVDHFRYVTTALDVPLEEIQGYLVYRIPTAAAQTAPPVPATAAPPPLEPMETDGAGLPEKPEEAGAEALVAMDTANLPEVLIGSEPWHNALPSEWVPVIARDSHRQRRQSTQKPFSDAYLTGMPPKRRKIIAATKPPGETISQTISEGVRHAIQAAGVSSPLAERAIAEAGRDPVLQQAYKQQEKASVGPGLRQDPDFKPTSFPNAYKFYNK